MFQLTSDGRIETLTIFQGGQTFLIDSGHPSFEKLKAAALAGELDSVNVSALTTDLDAALADTLSEVSDRVSYAEGHIMFDGQIVDKPITRHLVAMLHSGDRKWVGVVRFMERLAANPSPEARRHLWRWVGDRNLTITPAGSFVAYKGVQADGTSVHRGPGIIDGVPTDGHLPNQPGSVISIDRELVDANRFAGCSVGLHVGTYAYASNWGARLLTVTVDPADVVSVPMDCDGQKMRVCRYTVIDLAPPAPFRATSLDFDDEEDDDEEEFERYDPTSESGNLDDVPPQTL